MRPRAEAMDHNTLNRKIQKAHRRKESTNSHLFGKGGATGAFDTSEFKGPVGLLKHLGHFYDLWKGQGRKAFSRNRLRQRRIQMPRLVSLKLPLT